MLYLLLPAAYAPLQTFITIRSVLKLQENIDLSPNSDGVLHRASSSWEDWGMRKVVWKSLVPEEEGQGGGSFPCVS